jgi:hypothetical protein
MGFKHKTNAISENALMANKKKIREMERDMYIARDDMLALERETD